MQHLRACCCCAPAACAAAVRKSVLLVVYSGSRRTPDNRPKKCTVGSPALLGVLPDFLRLTVHIRPNGCMLLRPGWPPLASRLSLAFRHAAPHTPAPRLPACHASCQHSGLVRPGPPERQGCGRRLPPLIIGEDCLLRVELQPSQPRSGAASMMRVSHDARAGRGKRSRNAPATGDTQGPGGDTQQLSTSDFMNAQLLTLISTTKKERSGKAAAKECVKAARKALSSAAPSTVDSSALADGCEKGVGLCSHATTLSWLPPEAVELIGSTLYGTGVSSHSAPGHTENIDIAVKMPRQCFLAKDHLNHKYFDKRTLYAAHVLKLLRRSPMFAHATLGQHLEHGDHSRPIVVVTPGGSAQLKFHVRIIPHPGYEGLAARPKLLPSRNCNRLLPGDGAPAAVGRDGKQPQGAAGPATPLYNNRMLQDLLLVRVAAELRAAIVASPVLGKAMVLGKIWLSQRGLQHGPGGVCAFHVCLLLWHMHSAGIINADMTPWRKCWLFWHWDGGKC
jgi:hypothetical protein